MIYQNGEPKLINRGLVDTKPVDPSDYPEVQTITDSDKILAVIDGEPMLVNRGFVDTKPGTQPADYPIKTGVTYVFGLDQNGDPSKVTKANLLNGVDPTTYSEVTSKTSVDTVQVIDTNGVPKVIDVDTLVPDPIDPADYPVSATIADSDKIVTVINGEAKLVNRSTVASGGGGIDPSTLETLDFIDTVIGMDLDGEVGKIDFTTAVETEITTSPVSTTISDTDKVVTVINNEVKLVNKSAIGGGGGFDPSTMPTLENISNVIGVNSSGTAGKMAAKDALNESIVAYMDDQGVEQYDDTQYILSYYSGWHSEDDPEYDVPPELEYVNISDILLEGIRNAEESESKPSTWEQGWVPIVRSTYRGDQLYKVSYEDFIGGGGFNPESIDMGTIPMLTLSYGYTDIEEASSGVEPHLIWHTDIPTMQTEELSDITHIDCWNINTSGPVIQRGSVSVDDFTSHIVNNLPTTETASDTDYILIETASGALNKIRKSDLITGGGGTPSRDVTWAQYQALTEEEKMSDTDWYVKDRTVPSSGGSKDVDIANILESYENRMTIVDYTTKKYGNMVFAVVFCEAAVALSSSQNTIFKTTNNVLSFDYCYGNNTSWNYSTKSINRNSLSIEVGEGYMFAFYSKLVEED